jgi:hypothetical protein
MRLKHTVSKKHKNNRKSRGKSHKKVRSNKRRGGGCGCESTNPVSKFFVGGNTGGTTNALMALPANNYYPLNDYSKDPNYLVVGSGQTGNFVHSGGKRKHKRIAKTIKRNCKNKTKGVLGGGYINDATALFSPAISATMVGASSYGLAGTAFSPPQYSMYSATNPPPSA